MGTKSISECQFSAFISYAHADDEAWGNWIGHFKNELYKALAARLRGLKIPPMHFSSLNGPAHGILGDELRSRIDNSFCMIIVVHDNYVTSDWCLKEIEYFKKLFGDEGFRKRLYIIAMSETAIGTLERKSEWKQLFPDPQQVWRPFYKRAAEAKDQPLRIYIDTNVIDDMFWQELNIVREDLAKSIKSQPNTLTPPPQSRNVLIGVTTEALLAEVKRKLGATTIAGQPVKFLSKDTLLNGFTEFATADMLVLPFNDAQPLMPSLPGGHLALQRDAWLGCGKSSANLVWLDMRHVPTTVSADPMHQQFIAQCGSSAITAAELLGQLQERRTEGRTNGSDGVRIYIESNSNENKLWKSLGEEIKTKWDHLTTNFIKPALVPPLYVRPRGLPVDQLDRHPSLDDADGVVLLWGKNKTPDALVAQIDKVESRLSGRDLPPGIVAYLIPPHPPTQPMPAWGWTVLRFDAGGHQCQDASDEETDELYGFLREALNRKLKRQKKSQPLE